MIDCLHQLSCYRRVRLGTELQPLAELHGHLNDVNHVGLLVKFLYDRGKLCEFVTQSSHRHWVARIIHLRYKRVNGQQQLIDQFGTCDTLGRTCLLPSISHTPLGNGDTRDSYFSAISACSIPDMKSVLANERFFSISAFVMCNTLLKNQMCCKIATIRWHRQKVCNRFIDVCNHFTLFWRLTNLAVILQRKTQKARK